ncbi:MAG TPA: MFS transporter [Trebonia sp.]
MRDRDIRSLLIGYVVSAVGSGVGASALPIVAVLVLHAPAFEVSLLTGISGLAAAAIALPAGPVIERRRKRPVMMACDIIRFAALGSVPAAAALHALTYAQLVAVGVVSTAATIAFNSASNANLKALTDSGTRTTVNSWFETSNWISVSAGPPVGGLLISGLGATVTMAIDAVSYLGSAAGVWRMRAPAAHGAHPGCAQAAREGLRAGAGRAVPRRHRRVPARSGADAEVRHAPGACRFRCAPYSLDAAVPARDP